MNAAPHDPQPRELLEEAYELAHEAAFWAAHRHGGNERQIYEIEQDLRRHIDAWHTAMLALLSEDEAI